MITQTPDHCHPHAGALRRARAKFWLVVFDHFNPPHWVCTISCAKQFSAGTAGDGCTVFRENPSFGEATADGHEPAKRSLKERRFWLTGGFLRPRLQVSPQAAPSGPFPVSDGISDDKTLP